MFPAVSIPDAVLYGFELIRARFGRQQPPIVPTPPGRHPHLRLLPPLAPAYRVCVSTPTGKLVLSEHAALVLAVVAMAEITDTTNSAFVEYAGRIVAEARK